LVCSEQWFFYILGVYNLSIKKMFLYKYSEQRKGSLFFKKKKKVSFFPRDFTGIFPFKKVRRSREYLKKHFFGRTRAVKIIYATHNNFFFKKLFFAIF